MPIPTRLPNGRALIESGSDSAPALTLPDAAPITHGDLRAAAARTGRQLGPVKQLALIVADGSAEAMVGYISVLASGHAALLVADTSPAFIREIVNAYRPNWLGSQLPGGWAFRPESGAPLALHPELAVMLSTSGSTGAVKFVRLSYTNVIENARSIADYLELNASDRGLLTLPIHYSFGLSVLNSHLLSGASVLASPHALTDPALWGFFKREGGTSFAGVPHSYKLLDAIDFENLELPTLRTMTQAGGRLPRDTALKYAALAERKGFRFFLMYGQTEATARMAYVPPDEARRFPDCVGVPIPRGALHLIAADGSPITRAETEGELVYTGPNVMMGYATHLADLAAPPGPRELKTGDLAVLNEHGLVRITGRKSRFLKLFGLRISLDEIERKLEAQGIRAVCTGDDERLVVLVSGTVVGAALRGRVAAMATLPAGAVHVVVVEALPLLASGKIDLVEAKRIGLERIGVCLPTPPPDAAGATVTADSVSTAVGGQAALALQSVEALYAEVFPTAVIRSTSTFERLGGDSLTFVEASLGLEQFIGRLPANWPELTVQQLQARVHGAPQGAARRWAVVESAIVLRALAMFGIVAGHFDLIRHAGGAYFLLVAAGFSFSRFQLTQVLRTASVRPILTGAAKVAVPALLMLWAMSFMNGNYVPLQLVLLGNWAIPGKLNFGYWFVEVLPQLLLLVAAGLWFAPLRRVVKKTPYNSSVAFVVGALALSHAAQWLWTADHLYNRVPHMLLWLFALGWLVHRSEDTQQRLLTTAIVVVAPLLDAQPGPFDNFLASGMPWVWVGGVVLLWMPTLRLPRLTSALTHRVAGASLFIFLLHYSGRSLLHRMGLDIHPALDVAAGIAIGIGGWVLWERGTRWMASTLASIRPGWKTTVVNTVVTQW